VLRLLFAALVIVGHTPEIIDGNRSREPLTVLFHTVSLGEVAVDAFFLISGYLIARSMDRSSTLWRYLERRVLRIYPAFLVAYVLSVFVVGPLVGARVLEHLPNTFLRMATLHDPMPYAGRVAGQMAPPLNGSMWSIIYEFRCYLLIAALGVAGFLRKRNLMLGLAITLMAASIMSTVPAVRAILDKMGANTTLHFFVGQPFNAIRLTAIFLVGTCFYLFEDHIERWTNGWIALACAVLCVPLLFSPYLAEAGLATFGAVALFWVAFHAKLGPIQRINDSWDISYGVYLYGYPSTILLLSFEPAASVVSVAVQSLTMAAVLGAASWWGLEKWTKDGLPRHRIPASDPILQEANDVPGRLTDDRRKVIGGE
jgi:peptidoglycan/LPS O-acetylase OafA/YrhL